MRNRFARASAASSSLRLALAASGALAASAAFAPLTAHGAPSALAGRPAGESSAAGTAAAAGTSAAARGQTTIDGTVSVTIISSTLKHWGIAGADAAFVPDADSSRYARAIREAGAADALCAAIARAAGADSAISTAPVDGDGNLERRSGEEAQLALTLRVAGVATATPGRLYICSHPVVAVVSRGNYPDERFQFADGHRVSWISRRISLRPDEPVHVHLSASIDASQW